MGYLIEDRLSAVKLRSMAPISQTTFQDSDLITLLTDELLLKLVSDIFSVREDFFLTTKSQTITSGLAHYGIPKRAIGNTIKFLYWVDSAGNKKPLNKTDVDKAYEYNGLTGEPEAYYFEGDQIVLLPTPNSAAAAGSLLFSYHAKPNALIATSSCAKITAVSSVGGTTTLTVDTDLTADLSVGSKVDFVSAQNPYLLWAEDIALTAISSTQMQVATSDIVNAASAVEPQVDDYICPSGFANIVMLPQEFHPVLDQMGCVRLLAALGHTQKWLDAKAELKEMRTEALKLIKNRVESSPDVVARRNGLLKAFRGY